MDESLRGILKNFQLPARGPEYVKEWLLVLLVFFAMLVTFFFIGNLIVRSRERFKLVKATDKPEMTKEERDLILQAAQGRGKIDPDLMLNSVGEFHRLFGSMMHELMAKATSDREAKNALDKIFVLRKKLFGDVAYHFGTLTSTIQIRIGQNINLQFDINGHSLSVNTVVLDVDAAAITVTYPKLEGEKLHFVQGHPFRISFFRENDGYYQFDTHALRASEKDKAQFLLLSHALKIERIQSREFFRESTRIPFKFRRYAWDNRPETRYLATGEEFDQIKDGLILNLGGGGLLFSTSDSLGRNDLIAFDLPLNPEAVLPDILGKVVRVEPNPAEPGLIRVNLQFLNIRPGEQDLIVRLIQQHRIEKDET